MELDILRTRKVLQTSQFSWINVCLHLCWRELKISCVMASIWESKYWSRPLLGVNTVCFYWKQHFSVIAILMATLWLITIVDLVIEILFKSLSTRKFKCFFFILSWLRKLGQNVKPFPSSLYSMFVSFWSENVSLSFPSCCFLLKFLIFLPSPSFCSRTNLLFI